MASPGLHAVNLRLDLLRDVVVEMAAAQEPTFADRILAPIGQRWTNRLQDLDIDSRTDELIATDLALILAGLQRSRANGSTAGA